MLDIERALESYDGRSVSILTDIRVRFSQQNDFLTNLIDLVGSPSAFVSDGATWLLLDCLKEGATLNKNRSQH